MDRAALSHDELTGAPAKGGGAPGPGRYFGPGEEPIPISDPEEEEGYGDDDEDDDDEDEDEDDDEEPMQLGRSNSSVLRCSTKDYFLV